MGKIYFVSDAHLGAGKQQEEQLKERCLLSFLDHVKETGKALYVLGDLFDFWFEYRHVIPNCHYRILFKLAQLVDSGLEVNYVVGNHDFWLRDFLQTQVGLRVYKDSLELEADGKRFFITHGDCVSFRKDPGYRLLRKVLRNRLNIFLYSLLHPDLGIPFARLCSKGSRVRNSTKDFKDDAEYLEFAQEKFDQGYDGVILAHTHRPMLKKMGSNCFINIGEWMTRFTYGVLDRGELKLEQWTL